MEKIGVIRDLSEELISLNFLKKEVLRNNDINVVVNGHSFDLENFSSVLLEYADREIELLTEKLKQTIAGL